MVQHDHVVAKRLHRPHVVGGEKQGHALFSDKTQHFFSNQLGVDGIQATEWLVQDEQLRPMQHRGDELNLLGHPLAQIPHLAVPPPFHFQALEPTLQLSLGVGAFHATQRSKVEHLLGHAHAFVQAALFRQVSHARQQPSVVLLAPEREFALVRPCDAREHPKQGGFSSTIGAQQSHDAALPHLHVQRLQRPVVAERFANALGMDDGGGHENMSRTLSKNPRSPWSGTG